MIDEFIKHARSKKKSNKYFDHGKRVIKVLSQIKKAI